MKDHMNRVMIVINEHELSDGSLVYNINVPEYDIHVPTIAKDDNEALDMAMDLSRSLHKATGSIFKQTWDFTKE